MMLLLLVDILHTKEKCCVGKGWILLNEVTGEKFLQLLEEFSEKKNKIFIPSSHDERLSETVVKYFKRNYDYDIMIRCVKRYLMLTKDVSVSLDDFVKKLTLICDEVVLDINTRRQTKELLQKTKDRMEGFNK